VFALTYGRDAQWAQNVIEAGGCELTTPGRTYALTHPEIFHGASRHAAAPVARPMLRLVGASDFMSMSRSTQN
jgi:hypothetical protein